LPAIECAFGAEEIPSGSHVGYGTQDTHLTAVVSLYPLAWNLQQEQQLAQQKDMDGKSSAWKAYMAQVKAYEARNCTEQDGYKRPLVK